MENGEKFLRLLAKSGYLVYRKDGYTLTSADMRNLFALATGAVVDSTPWRNGDTVVVNKPDSPLHGRQGKVFDTNTHIRVSVGGVICCFSPTELLRPVK